MRKDFIFSLFPNPKRKMKYDTKINFELNTHLMLTGPQEILYQR